MIGRDHSDAETGLQDPTAPANTSTDSHPSGGRGAWRWAAFPIVVLGVLLVMVGLDLNGSSIAAFSDSPEDHGLLFGEPLGVRSDEYLLETPNALSSTQQGLPLHAWIGLAEIDQAVAAGGGPALDWSTLLKPQDWGFVILGESRGLAWNWWFPFAVCLWGVFALIGVITRRATLSAALAVVAAFTPYSAWWSPDLFVGYAALAGAAILGAWLVRSKVVAASLAFGAGLSAGALAMVLYPAWQFSLALVIVALCLGFCLDRRIGLRRVLWTSAIAVTLAAGTLFVWYLQHSAAITAIANTYYPGQRRTTAGGGSPSVLLGAPLNFWMVGDAGASLGAGGVGGQYSNLSEASSSWFPWSVVILVAAGAALTAWRIRSDRRRAARTIQDRGHGPHEPVWTIGLLSGLIAVLLAWSFLPLPDWFGAVTQLQRVQPSRTTLALGFAALLVIAIATTMRARPGIWNWPWLLVAAIVGAVATIWSAESLPWDAELVPTSLAALSGFVLAALFAALLHRRSVVPAAALLAIYAFASWSLVNPLQHGISPLTEDPLVRELRRVADPETNPRTLVFGDLATVARVRAAGFQSVSGTTPYPDADLMAELAPSQEALWNNYAQYEWAPAPDGTPARIERVSGSMMRLTISPCNAVVAERTDPQWVVSEVPLDGYACLERLSEVDGAGGGRLHLYRRG